MNGPLRFVFAYGLLLEPGFLAATLPSVALDACVPCRLPGFERRFGVAFPNDGREHDKAYYDSRGVRPPWVLFWNLVRRPGVITNGVCVPVGDQELTALERRELRYDLVELRGVEPYDDGALPPNAAVLGFLGKEQYTREQGVAGGLVARRYLDDTVRGAEFWDARLPGFSPTFTLAQRSRRSDGSSTSGE